MALTTPEAVIHRAGLAAHPEYEDVAPMKEDAGFYTFRPYPSDTTLARILTADGRAAVRCYLAFIVEAPAKGSHTSRLILKARLARRWVSGWIVTTGPDPYTPSPGDPNAPTEQSALLLKRARKPIDLDSQDAKGYIYDNGEDKFLDDEGRVVTPLQILEDMFTKHCRTLGLWFRIRWNIGSGARWVVRESVWKSQDVAMWALFNFYDVELVEDKKDMRWSFFYKYKPGDFRRVTDKPNERSHFFGFQSSQKSFFTNLSVVVLAFLLLYWLAPRGGLLRVVYNNTALSTAALVFAFLLADTLGPWLLIRIICGLSRVRDTVLFFIRKVRV
jgi:hypothetical protein